MFLYVLLAGAAGLLLWRRFNPDVAPGGGHGSSDQDSDVELGVAEDGTFVLVRVPKFSPGSGGPSSPMPPQIPPSFAPPGAFTGNGQPSVNMNAPGYDGKVSVGHVGNGKSCTGSPPSCAPGRDCCDDCRKGIVEVNGMPHASVTPISNVQSMAANLAWRMSRGDEDATRRAHAIFSLALESGDPQARFLAECVTRSLDAYRTPGLPTLQRRVRVAIDDPNITNGYEELAGMGRVGVWNG